MPPSRLETGPHSPSEQGGLTNNGSVTLDSTENLTSISIKGGGDENMMTIDGTGSIIFDSPLDGLVGATNHTLIHASPHTIQGAGTVGGNFIKIINRGTISADDSTGTMVLDPRDTLANEGGTLSAFSGGVLQLNPATYTSTGEGRFLVGDDSTIALAGAEVESTAFEADNQDGDLTNNAYVVTVASSISDVTNNASISIGDRTTLTVGAGGLTNNGSVTLESTENLTSISIKGGGDENMMTIDGTGSIIFDSPLDGLVGATNHTLIHASPHTIQGVGTVGGNFIKIINRGTISADDSTGTMVLDPRDTLANEGGTLSAISGGVLQLNSATSEHLTSKKGLSC